MKKHMYYSNHSSYFLNGQNKRQKSIFKQTQGLVLSSTSMLDKGTRVSW